MDKIENLNKSEPVWELTINPDLRKKLLKGVAKSTIQYIESLQIRLSENDVKLKYMT